MSGLCIDLSYGRCNAVQKRMLGTKHPRGFKKRNIVCTWRISTRACSEIRMAHMLQAYLSVRLYARLSVCPYVRQPLCLYSCMDCADVWTVWTVWIYGCADAWMDEWVCGWMDGCMVGWLDVWNDGCMDAWMDVVCICVCINISIHILLYTHIKTHKYSKSAALPRV